MIDLFRVGAQLDGDNIRFGIYLPDIEKEDEISLTAKISHVSDFAWENTLDCSLNYLDNQDGYSFYEGQLDLTGQKKGLYRYQYEVHKKDTIYPRWASDPFAKLTAAGHRSAFLYDQEEKVKLLML